jgi:hypothetical protein
MSILDTQMQLHGDFGKELYTPEFSFVKMYGLPGLACRRIGMAKE